MAIHPTQLQLALALVVVRSKPADLFIVDYIHQLRQHIICGRRPQFSKTYEESQHKYINAAHHFQSLLKDAKKTEQKLRNRIAGLEREKAKLKLQVVAGDSPLGRKSTGDLPNLDLGSEDSAAEFTNATFPECETLLRCTARLSKTLDSNESMERVGLALGRACRAMAGAMQARAKMMNGFEKNTKLAPDLRQFLNINFVLLGEVFEACTHLAASETVAESLKSSAVCDLLALFKRLLDILPVCCSNKTGDPDGPQLASALATLLLRFVRCLVDGFEDTGDVIPATWPCYRSLTEGVMYLLLVRAGNLLSTITFTLPEAELDTGGGVATETSATMTAARAEAKLLTPILRLLIPSTVHTSFQVDDIIMTGQGPPSPYESPPVPRLLRQPLEKLQKTLMRGMFGNRNVDAGKTCLALPRGFESHLAEDIAGVDRAGEQHDGDADDFIVEMWCRVGWDVLMPDIESLLSS